MSYEMAGIEGSCLLLQRKLLARPFRSFEQDDRAAPMRDLGELKLAQMIPQRAKRRRELGPAARPSKSGFPLDHRTGS